MKRAEEESGVSELTRRIIQEYVNSLLLRNIEGNDLNTPLIQLNYDLFVERLQELLLMPSSFDITKEDKERIYHVFVLAVLTGRIDGFEIKSNKESGRGRYDIALIPLVNTLTGVLIEVKKIDEDIDPKGELEKASKQMNEKGYIHEFKQRNIGKVLKISLVYSGLKPTLEKELIETFN